MLCRGADRLSPTAWARLLAGLERGDNDRGEVGSAWLVGQELRGVYAAPDLADGRRRLTDVLIRCAFAEVPELTRCSALTGRSGM